MGRVRPGGSDRWQSRASSSEEAYVVGISNPRRDWAKATADAEDNWKKGIQDAITAKRFAKGVNKAGSEKQKRRAVEVGATRFSQGVNLGKAAYEAGVAPYYTVIENTSLPPRYPKGDPRNIDRVKKITEALRAKKLSM